MAQNNDLVITAGLNVESTVKNIEKSLANEVSPSLDSKKALKITCNIDTAKTVKTIQKQLDSISRGIKININNITLNAKTEKIIKNFTDVSTSANKAEESIKKVNKSLADLDDRYVAPLNAVLNLDGFVQAEETISQLKNRLSSMGDVTIKGEYNDNASEDSLYRLVATVKAVSGEVRTLNFELDETDNKFKYIGGSFSDKGVGAVEQAVSRYKKELASFEQSHTSIMSGLVEPFKEAETAIENLANGTGSIEAVENAVNNLKTEAASIGTSLKSTGASFNIFDNAVNKSQNFDNVLKALKSDVDNLTTATSKSSLTSDIELATSKLRELQDIESTSGRNQVWADTYGELSRIIQSVTNDLKAVQKAEQDYSKNQTLQNRIAKTSAALNDYANKNERAISSTKLMSDGITTFAEKWKELTSRIESGELSADEFKHLNEEIAIFKKEADAAGLSTSAFFKNMGAQLRSVITQWLSLNMVISKVRDMINNVIDIDTAMTDLKKVTDETDETYERFLKNAHTQAKNLHSTITDLVTQTSEWSKLGYSLADAQELAQTSMIYSKVGDVDNLTAVSDLVTVLKAFDMEAENSIEIVDRLNILGNEFATSAGDLGSGLSVSASTLKTAGNDLSQTLALITGGAEILQNPTETGNALKIISLRLRAMTGALQELNEETDGIESISKIQTQILNLTSNKVNIFNDDGSFKSTYDILKEISEVYNDLSDTNRASLTEIMFGKNRSNQGIAILQAFQSGQIEKAYQAAENSAGSAQAEFDKWSESLEAHINDFKESWENLSKDLVNNDFLKGLIDTGTGLINVLDTIIDKAGLLPTILSTVAGISSIKGVGKPSRICLFTHRCILCA